MKKHLAKFVWAGVVVILAVWGWLHFTGWPVTDEEFGLALYNCSQPDVEEQFVDCSAELSDAQDAGRTEAREWAEKWGTESD